MREGARRGWAGGRAEGGALFAGGAECWSDQLANDARRSAHAVADQRLLEAAQIVPQL